MPLWRWRPAPTRVPPSGRDGVVQHARVLDPPGKDGHKEATVDPRLDTAGDGASHGDAGQAAAVAHRTPWPTGAAVVGVRGSRGGKQLGHARGELELGRRGVRRRGRHGGGQVLRRRRVV